MVYIWRSDRFWLLDCISPGTISENELHDQVSTYYGVSTLCIVNGNIGSEKYLHALNIYLGLAFAKHFLGNKHLYMDDNALVHWSHFFTTKYSNNISLLDWPAQSLNLNSIEMDWLAIKKKNLQNHLNAIKLVDKIYKNI